VTQVAAGQSESRKVLVSLRAAIKLTGEARGLPETSELVKAIERLGAVPPVRPPDTSVLDRARRNLIAAAGSPGGLASAQRRDLKFAPWLLWTGSDGIAGLPGMFDILFREAERLGSVRRSLIESWIANCDTSQPTVQTCGSLIELLLGKSDDARIEVWRRAEARFQYFRVQSGPGRIASAILNGTEPVTEILKAAGLDEPLRAASGYARLVNFQLLKELPPPLASSWGESVFARAQAFAVVGRTLRFEEAEARGALANSLLTPWAPGSRLSARGDVRSQVQSFLLTRLGDPRTRRANWLHVEESKIGVMRRWLSRASLKAFFDVVANHAHENFEYRRAFWNAYLEAEAIEDSWLALGANVHAEAQGIRELQGSFARLRGASSNQSVLLIKVGPVIFSEWSHSGSLRAWPEDWKDAPRIGLPEYRRLDLTGKCLPFPNGPDGAQQGKGLWHVGSENGRWQSVAADFIAGRCGVRLTQRHWMPK
jgi:hypothetical protein